MADYPGADLVYGFKINKSVYDFEFDEEKYDDFMEYFDDFLSQKKLEYVFGGNHYHQEEDELFGVIGISKSLFPSSFIRVVNHDKENEWVEQAKKKFTLELLEEVKDFLHIKEEINLQLYEVVFYN